MPPSSERTLHPLVEAASEGRFPDWIQAGEERRKHMSRVGELLRSWALERNVSSVDVARWAAVGYLHDVLRDANPEELRQLVDGPLRAYPGKVLHGPAAARRLEEAGVGDQPLLHAIAFHTLGSPEFSEIGLALFAADFLEPGRKLKESWRARLRHRASHELEGVVKEILEARLRHLLERGRPLRTETVAFWNRMAEGKEWASASEV